MRFFQSMVALALLIFFTFAFTACGDNAAQEGDAVETEVSVSHGEGKEFTSAYVCPMHCDGSGSEVAGKCPVCGMDYVAQAEHTENGHTH